MLTLYISLESSGEVKAMKTLIFSICGFFNPEVVDKEPINISILPKSFAIRDESNPDHPFHEDYTYEYLLSPLTF